MYFLVVAVVDEMRNYHFELENSVFEMSELMFCWTERRRVGV